jgi:uncharacterized protein YigE (DUF2233 family)
MAMIPKIFLTLSLVCFCALDGFAGEKLSAGASYHELTVPSGSGEVTVRAVQWDDRQCALRVIDQPQASGGSNLLGEKMRSVRAIAGVNGGYFSKEFTPMGLVISSGKALSAYTSSSLISGMVLVKKGRPRLVWNMENISSAGAQEALQAGPRLISQGQAIPGLNASRRAVRTFIATDGAHRWLLGTTDSITLAELPGVITAAGSALSQKIDRALNLDGGRSTALYVRHIDGTELIDPGWSTVRNYLAVVPVLAMKNPPKR